MLDQQKMTSALSHVLWIAGSPCSGKSTISHTIARIHVFIDYHVDSMARNHVARRLAEGDAEMEAFLKMNMDQRWLERSVEDLFQEVIVSWPRGFRLVIEDLLAMPKEWFIIAEGNFFPESLAPYLSNTHQAIWLVPTDSFCEQARRRKHAELSRRLKRMGIYNEGSDPEKRLRNLIDRDIRLAHYIKQQATALHLPLCEVDGSRSTDEMTDLVEKHFEPYIKERLKHMKYI